jgi:hypothetical protein
VRLASGSIYLVAGHHSTTGPDTWDHNTHRSQVPLYSQLRSVQKVGRPIEGPKSQLGPQAYNVIKRPRSKTTVFRNRKYTRGPTNEHVGTRGPTNQPQGPGVPLGGTRCPGVRDPRAHTTSNGRPPNRPVGTATHSVGRCTLVLTAVAAIMRCDPREDVKAPNSANPSHYPNPKSNRRRRSFNQHRRR